MVGGEVRSKEDTTWFVLKKIPQGTGEKQSREASLRLLQYRGNSGSPGKDCYRRNWREVNGFERYFRVQINQTRNGFTVEGQ